MVLNRALVVGARIISQRRASIAPGVLQARLLRMALLLYVSDGGLLVRRSWAYSKRRGVLGLLRMVLGGGRCLVL